LLATLPATARASKPTRRMIVAIALMAAVYGARAVSTPEQTLYVIRLWIDVLVLPLILFLVVRRGVLRDQGLLERIALAMMVAGSILGLIGIAEHILGFQLATLAGSQVRFDTKINAVRVSGPYPGPETYGLTLLMCLAA